MPITANCLLDSVNTFGSVIAALFASATIISGGMKAFGVVYLELLDIYDVGEFLTSLASAMNTLTGVFYSKCMVFFCANLHQNGLSFFLFKKFFNHFRCFRGMAP